MDFEQIDNMDKIDSKTTYFEIAVYVLPSSVTT